jgi:hypothetical protein
MVQQVRSKSTAPNPEFTALKRKAKEGNLAWGERAVQQMGTGGHANWTYAVLLGGADTLSYRLRMAQAHLRRDMLPSSWSECLLVELASDTLAGAKAIHVPLLQPDTVPLATRENGVISRPLSDFDASRLYPNVALIALPVPQADILAKVEQFKRSRSTLDALEHVLRWLAFAWGVARTPNPLHENYGFPSACLLETAFAAARFDLTPGLESRASCPEAIWVAARYWYEYFQEFAQAAPKGRFAIGHRYPIIEA